MSGSAPSSAVSAGRPLRIAVVAARFHGAIVDDLVHGALDALAGVEDVACEVFRVPGAWEVPVVVDAALSRADVDGAVALACLVRGDTMHFELLAEESTRGLGRATARHGKPVGHAILACENLAQALERSAPGVANKGREAALAVAETARTLDLVRRRPEVAK
jgi:6,7-dimethyl-8-ribityllumazine synthase